MNLSFEISVIRRIYALLSCCILNWNVLTLMLPAFLLGGAIRALVPPGKVLYYLGPHAPPSKSYPLAIGSGFVLSLCSCNVVPLFLSIWRSGAGAGPALAFLYAGPAINILTIAFTLGTLGMQMTVGRVVAVIAISVIVGAVGARLVKEKRELGGEAVEPAVKEMSTSTVLLFVLLLIMILLGAVSQSWSRRVIFLGLIAAGTLSAGLSLGREKLRAWMRETGRLLWVTLPVLVPTVLVLGYILQSIQMDWLWKVSEQSPMLVTGLSSVAGALMYFPILTETATTSLLVRTAGIGAGAGMALLLTGPGLSLPGMLVVWREIGAKRTLLHIVLVALFSTGFGLMYELLEGVM